MPRAVRKGDAAPAPPPQTTTRKGVEVAMPSNLRAVRDFWHKRVNVLSGDMVLCRTGIKRSMLLKWIMELRLLADEMEKRLGD